MGMTLEEATMSENNPLPLVERKCVPCSGGTPPLKGEELHRYQQELGGYWQVIEEQRLEKIYKFKNFRQALDFTVRVGELAESINHHPDIYLAWGQVKLTLWTHKIGGLSESDFILAARADALYVR
jgi:4a-hydroxytetrahydrobiopterin dehydratase